ncbi:MAG TPA: hypothetical protein VJT09_00295 [Pyrinomonadaceae bacterium]|nr:hypothetical protein [Pyrinomonadaceae bacterium]
MKRCPVCQKTYDDTQNFCLDDGSTLMNATDSPMNSAGPTENLSYNRNSAPTEVLYGNPTAGQQGATTPPPYMTPPPPPPYQPLSQSRKKSPLPWFLVGALALVAAIIGIYFATRGSGGTMTSGGVPGSTPRPSPTRTSATPSTSGVVYDDPEGKFTLTLPPGFSPFKSQKQTQQTLAGPIELSILQSETPAGAAVVGYSDFPEASFQGRSEKKMLEDGRDGALRNIQATLEKQEDFTVQGKTALDVYGSTNQQGKSIYVRFQFILDKPRAYQIGYLAYNRDDLDKPEVQAYFDSFKIK